MNCAAQSRMSRAFPSNGITAGESLNSAGESLSSVDIPPGLLSDTNSLVQSGTAVVS